MTDKNIALVGTGKRARPRSRFSSVASERDFQQKLTVARQLRQHGTRHSAEFMARYKSLRQLKRDLNYVNGCIRSL